MLDCHGRTVDRRCSYAGLEDQGRSSECYEPVWACGYF